MVVSVRSKPREEIVGVNSIVVSGCSSVVTRGKMVSVWRRMEDDDTNTST